MANPENLTPWPKGTSGNPKGSSRTQRISGELWRLIEERNCLEALATVWLTNALKGDFAFFRELLERLDGPTLGEQMKLALLREKQEGTKPGIDVTDIVGEAEQRAADRKQERDKPAD